MRIPYRSAAVLVFTLAAAAGYSSAADPASTKSSEPDEAALEWPELTQTARPWTRWWWHGSAVDKENLTRCLETYEAAGIGGVEITSIYGVQGEEHRDIQYLSDKWLEVASHAIREAQRLGMGVDLPPGSGWRIGGPSVEREDGNVDVVLESEEIDGGATFRKTYAKLYPQAVVAYGVNGETISLTDRIESDGSLAWTPSGNDTWTVYSLGMKYTGEKVKRPGPGGEGLNINPYGEWPIKRFLEYFGKRIESLPEHGVRASFHDSFEYEGSWCDSFLDEFHKRRGYRLEDHLPALKGDGDPRDGARIKTDYRETIADLVLHNLIEPWVAWSHDAGMLVRNQAHGSPGNWLDLYAAADIPETESFGRFADGDARLLLFKFASSAAHVAGRQLVSSETATWLDEHFTVTLAQIKELVDQQFLAGINHTVYQGTAYSPTDARWPGWVFYASTQVNPQNPIWRDLPALNRYIARCQAMLQSSSPDNDLLVYWPIHDVWNHPEGMRENLTVHNAAKWLLDTSFGRAAKWLDTNGYAFDYVSDRLLSKCRIEDGRIIAPGSSYRAVLIPHANLMPEATLQKLRELADSGGQIIFLEALPVAPPGLITPERQQEFDRILAVFDKALEENKQTAEPVVASLGKGRLVVGEKLADILVEANVEPESCRQQAGIQFIRRKFAGGNCYFLMNAKDARFDGWITLGNEFQSAALMDPMSGVVGMAEVKDDDKIRLQLNPEQSVFVRAFETSIAGRPWPYEAYAGEAVAIDGNWQIEFVSGGPQLPAPQTKKQLVSWTEFPSSDYASVAGTAAYTITFDRPSPAVDRYVLDLGRVLESARVLLNGEEIGSLICPPYQVAVGPLRSGQNELRIEVTNVAANRIRDLDRRGARWRIFRDINLVNIDYKPFDASNWPVRDAGLLGPVTLRPLQ